MCLDLWHLIMVKAFCCLGCCSLATVLDRKAGFFTWLIFGLSQSLWLGQNWNNKSKNQAWLEMRVISIEILLSWEGRQSLRRVVTGAKPAETRNRHVCKINSFLGCDQSNVLICLNPLAMVCQQLICLQWELFIFLSSGDVEGFKLTAGVGRCWHGASGSELFRLLFQEPLDNTCGRKAVWAEFRKWQH